MDAFAVAADELDEHVADDEDVDVDVEKWSACRSSASSCIQLSSDNDNDKLSLVESWARSGRICFDIYISMAILDLLSIGCKLIVAWCIQIANNMSVIIALLSITTCYQ